MFLFLKPFCLTSWILRGAFLCLQFSFIYIHSDLQKGEVLVFKMKIFNSINAASDHGLSKLGADIKKFRSLTALALESWYFKLNYFFEFTKTIWRKFLQVFGLAVSG